MLRHWLGHKLPLPVVAVRDMKTWDLMLWVEETETKGLWGWVKRKLGLHRKTFHNKCECGCFLRCTRWAVTGWHFCQSCYDVCSIAWVHPGNYNHPVLLTDLKYYPRKK